MRRYCFFVEKDSVQEPNEPLIFEQNPDSDLKDVIAQAHRIAESGSRGTVTICELVPITEIKKC